MRPPRVSRRCASTRATLHYLENRELYKTVKPYHINLPAWALPPGRQTNEVSIPYHDIPIADLRNIKAQFTLDRNGFEIQVEDGRGPKSLLDCVGFEDYDNREAVQAKVLPAVEDFLKRKLPGVDDVIAFSYQVRRRDAQFPTLHRGTDAHVPQPVQGVHIGEWAPRRCSNPSSASRNGSSDRYQDMTPDSARNELQGFLAARGYGNISNRRWQIIRHV